MGRLFGTDGLRGEANVTLTAELSFRLGRFLGAYHSDRSGKRRLITAEDTRLSSGMLSLALAAGAAASGADVYRMGVAPTPALSYAAAEGGFDCAVMITASHNPFYDNGLKVLSGEGTKLSDEETEEIEAYLTGSIEELPYASSTDIGRICDYPQGVNAYKERLIHIAAAEGLRLGGEKIAIDTAHGAASGIAADIFRELGATVTAIGDSPNGININDNVGSTHPEKLGRLTKESGSMIGFAFDGDADRCLSSDEEGRLINGDRLMYVSALALAEAGRLRERKIAVTVMSNLGFLRALEKEGIGYEVTQVGDRFVWACIEKEQLSLGGEQSGHVIFADYAVTGDGLLTAIMTLSALKKTGMKPSDIIASCPMYPQTLINVRVSDPGAAVKADEVLFVVRKEEERLSGSGRVLVRPSGTEPLVRVMTEAESEGESRRACEHIADILRGFT